SAPDSLLDALARSKPSSNVVNGKDLNRTQKEVIPNVANPIVPTCLGAKSNPTQLQPNPPDPPPCQALTIYSDDSDLPKADSAQLLEFTLGAAPENSNPNTNFAFTLDTRNVDFDVSYVNVAFLPAVMGVLDNNQVGYTGSPLKIGQPTTPG